MGPLQDTQQYHHPLVEEIQFSITMSLGSHSYSVEHQYPIRSVGNPFCDTYIIKASSKSS